MSTSASTVPGKRDPFVVKRPEIDSRLIRRPRKILRGLALPEADEHADSGQGDILVEREDFHKEFGKGRGFSYAFVGDEEAKVWTKSKPIKGEIEEVYKELAAEKVKKERKFGPNTLAKAFSRPTRPLNDKLVDLKNRKANRQDYRKFMNLGPKKVKNSKNDALDETSYAHKALMPTGLEDANKVAEERRQLLEFDRVARKRIKQLEAEVDHLEQSFESLTRENEHLRAKLQSDDQVVIETYQRVYQDREMLRKSETSYKSIIKSLESQLKEKQKAIETLQKELKGLKEKQPTAIERLQQQAETTQSFWDSKTYKSENTRLRKLNEQLTKDKQELQKRIANSTITSADTLRPLKTSLRKEHDFPIDYNPYLSDSTPRKVTFSRHKKPESGIVRKYDNNNLYGEDLLNMLTDQHAGKRGLYMTRT